MSSRKPYVIGVSLKEGQGTSEFTPKVKGKEDEPLPEAKDGK